MGRILFVLLGLLAISGEVAASEGKTRYQMRVVVSTENHPLLTKIFSDQLTRELGDALRSALGNLANIETTSKHPRLEQIQANGLGKALDSWDERSKEMTYFVLVSFSGTQYEIQTRMHDGLTGLASPTIRKDRTRDRAYVARIAALLVEQDLGLGGTISSEVAADRTVKVALQGGELATDLERWFKKDEILSIIQLGAGRGSPLPSAYLQIVSPPRNGEMVCRLLARFDLSKAKLVGLRAVLLGTQKGPVRVRVLEKPEKAGDPLRIPRMAITVQIRRSGFEAEDATKISLTPRAGDVDTSSKGEAGLFNKIAFVTVVASGATRARVPVPIVDDRIEVISVTLGGAGENDQLLARYRSLQEAIVDAAQVQNDLFKKINELTAKPDKRVEALKILEETSKRSKDDYERLKQELGEVAAELAKLPSKGGVNLAALQKRLDSIRSAEKEINGTIKELQEIEAKENDPKRKDWKIQHAQAQRLEKEGEIGQALEIYQKCPDDLMTPELKKHLEELTKKWTPLDEEHIKARKFLYETWPKLDTEKLFEKVKEATQSLEVCKKHKDKIGAAKLLKELELHVKRLEKELADLKPDVNLDDQKLAKRIQDLVPQLKKLDEEARPLLN
jgi:hypothetical protein